MSQALGEWTTDRQWIAVEKDDGDVLLYHALDAGDDAPGPWDMIRIPKAVVPMVRDAIRDV